MADITHVISNSESSESGSPVTYDGNPEAYYNRLKKEVGEDVVEELNPILDKLTVSQLQCLREYISECCHQMSKELEKTVTMEDFESAKKDDVDGDNEEGEDEEGDDY